MKRFFILVTLTLLFVSCKSDDETTFNPYNPVVVDHFFVKLTENNQVLNINSASYTSSEHYEVAAQNAYLNEGNIGIHKSASVNATGLYETENIATAKVGFSIDNMGNNGDTRLEGFAVEIMASNQKDIICNQEDVLVDEIYNPQIKQFYQLRLSTNSIDDVLIDTNLALINISYKALDPITQNEKVYQSFSNIVIQSNLYPQPDTSFFNIVSITDKIHRVESIENDDSNLESFNYDYILEGNGRIRVYNRENPTGDFKDLEFEFKIPSKKLVPFTSICN